MEDRGLKTGHLSTLSASENKIWYFSFTAIEATMAMTSEAVGIGIKSGFMDSQWLQHML